ncbi:MAG: HD domain-containing protein, partial [Planctomycetes bacterium]|nr:HD domain-containing protein [Planctomycetota bacterium]
MPKGISINDLAIDQPIRKSIFSANGDLLLPRGRTFGTAHRAAFGEFMISDVFIPVEGESDDDCTVALKYEERDIMELGDEDALGIGVHDPSGRLLVQAGKTLNAQQREMLLRHGVFRVHLRKNKDKGLELRSARLSTRLRDLARESATTKVGKSIVSQKVATARISKDTAIYATAKLDQLADAESKRMIEMDKAVRALVEPQRLSTPAHPEDLMRVRDARRRLFNEASAIFRAIVSGAAIEGKVFDDFTRNVITSFVSDRYHRLHLASKDENENYLVSHSLTTLVLSINMAARLNYALPEILELSYGAFLHDIGMTKVPADLREKKGKLAEAERRLFELHPSHGIEFCRRISNLPVTVPLVMLQENERMDGSGYPRKRTAEKIHPYARIVAVAAAYDAMTHERPYRPAKPAYLAMREL